MEQKKIKVSKCKIESSRDLRIFSWKTFYSLLVRLCVFCFWLFFPFSLPDLKNKLWLAFLFYCFYSSWTFFQLFGDASLALDCFSTSICSMFGGLPVDRWNLICSHQTWSHRFSLLLSRLLLSSSSRLCSSSCSDLITD